MLFRFSDLTDKDIENIYWSCEWKSEWENFEKNELYNKTVIYWLLEQHQFGLTFERICCPQPKASGDKTLIFWYVTLEALWYMDNVDLSEHYVDLSDNDVAWSDI